MEPLWLTLSKFMGNIHLYHTNWFPQNFWHSVSFVNKEHTTPKTQRRNWWLLIIVLHRSLGSFQFSGVYEFMKTTEMERPTESWKCSC